MNREDLVKRPCERQRDRKRIHTKKGKCKKLASPQNSKITAVSVIMRQRERGAQSGRINDQMDTRA